jgi:hypothetical protein
MKVGLVQLVNGILKFDDDERQEWWANGVRHREDGPAVIFKQTGRKVWFDKGLLHRVDGPAITDPVYGDEYYINYKNITHEVKRWAKYNEVDLQCMKASDEVALSFFLLSFIKT